MTRLLETHLSPRELGEPAEGYVIMHSALDFQIKLVHLSGEGNTALLVNAVKPMNLVSILTRTNVSSLRLNYPKNADSDLKPPQMSFTRE
jgi:hypothetical protein